MSSLETDFIKPELGIVKDYLSFVNGSPSHFHAVAQASSLLTAAGFKQISERKDEDWAVKPGEKYFFTRNQSTIIAFAVGRKWAPGGGFNIVGAHTDSPVLKVKPISKTTGSGYLQVGIEPYGGGLWGTWFDRDLSVAGRVIVAEEDGSFQSRLTHIKRPIMRIPNLAIHLDREPGQPNKQKHLLPILATAAKAELMGDAKEEKKEVSPAETTADHHPLFMKLVAEDLKVDVSRIREFELCLYDTQPATLGGAFNEFIFSRALDNLMMSFVGLRALIDSSAADGLDGEDQVRMVALFDNEEIGSGSAMGADSTLLPTVLARINGDPKSLDSALRNSILVSADMAHAIHPNYAEKHEPLHRPELHKGLVIKQNANQRYATSSVTSFFISEIARRHKVPVQKFTVRNDVGCGSTIGPILAANCGVRTVDVGIPQLSMHSIREMCGTADVLSAHKLLVAFFREFSALDKSLVGAD